MTYKSITNDPLQSALVNEFMDSRYFGDQHWFAARAEIEALWARIQELEARNGKKGGVVNKSDTVSEEG